ncbi:glycosyltransferase involved in cell wall biosynthesis [Desulfobotulus alkaliphilus]|uniref:Glycosyltransferase involved in cell wall biosynthesis n=1 Tax=Desulfobotulus alkaliphilus TaxID=622671 RepID=A0A562R4K3_9BACT|nr:glycosyltransferase family 4 protein [Desulfobotulus alkaliphilus]TWI63380.1 glycosyltransferase involved in cell wall biosynthesis [Desulfobotulus alkaliphilus]
MLHRVHVNYRFYGGEDAVFLAEGEILKAGQVEYTDHCFSNDSIQGFFSKLSLFFTSCFNFRLSHVFREYNFSAGDIVHVHNLFPLISPSLFYFMKKRSVATVYTLHNFRNICPTALLMVDGRPDERSLVEGPYWAVKKKVYRNSLWGTLALANNIQLHKTMGTWSEKVDRFICLTHFAKNKFIEAGFPENKICVKPNCVMDPGYADQEKTGLPLFVGRMSPEKGVRVLEKAAVKGRMHVDCIGEGDTRPESAYCNCLGLQRRDAVFSAMGKAPFMIVPSLWYEGFPMVIVEAFSVGTPVLCSNIGSLAELVEDRVTGLHFEAGNADDLAEKMQWMLDHPDEVAEMGRRARREYEAKYTPERNFEILMDIYRQAVQEASKK